MKTTDLKIVAVLAIASLTAYALYCGIGKEALILGLTAIAGILGYSLGAVKRQGLVGKFLSTEAEWYYYAAGLATGIVLITLIVLVFSC